MLTLPRVVKPAKFLYAIREKETKQLLNKKSNSANQYYADRKVAENRLDESIEEIVTYQLSEFNT